MATWSIITQTTTSWISVTEGGDDWVDPRSILLTTESGLDLRTEDDGFLAIEAVTAPATSSWILA